MTSNLLTRDAKRLLAVFVGGGTDALAYVEPMLGGQAYELEFVASDDEPYATIAALKPDIVVVSLDLNAESGFQLLTMLRLDHNTARIPVLSYIHEEDVALRDDASVEVGGSRLSSAAAARVQRH